ncbi:MAG TPA: amino acid adenylation domain-containing protein [Pseudonocardiaceae bacterium]|nr:amino acid adenylation domain-containing protein [Pseudonocardiaceae bacterium]
MTRDSHPRTLVETLRLRAEATPDRLAFEFELPDADPVDMTYADLDRAAMAVAALVMAHGEPGQRVLLPHAPGPHYVAAFFGCLYAGAIAVPAYPPTGGRGLDRLTAITQDAEADLALTDTATLATIDPAVLGRPIRWVTTEDLAPATVRVRVPDQDDVAFLQYTSGSTGTPMGVLVSHGNLAHNSAVISDALDLDEHSRSVSWLPPYHDMGLIGGILQPIHSGFPGTVQSPQVFLRRPLLWLQALSRTGATITAAPNFAYAEAVRRTDPEQRASLDLSALRHAMVGAEPIRATTLSDFATAFGPAGFHCTAFYPCYGLAEATLFVTGSAGPVVLRADRSELDSGRIAAATAGPATTLTGCGRAHGGDTVLVVDPESRHRLPDDTVGEIWVSGPTVALGYHRRPTETAVAFHATLADEPGRTFLRTGDLGCWHHGELFVVGRIKDLIVVRGRNHHPQDIERTAEGSHPLLRPLRGAAFAVDDGDAERAVLVHEVTARFRAADAPNVIQAIRAAVTEEHGLALDEVVLIRPGTIPRTSSGKIRRSECRRRWQAGTLPVLASSTGTADDRPPEPDQALALVAAILDVPAARIVGDVPLVAQGLDSLRAVQLAETISTAGGTRITAADLLAGRTPDQLAAQWRTGEQPPDPRPVAAPDLATPAQERMWLLDRMGAGAAYHIAGALRLTGALDVDLLRDCLATVLTGCPGVHTVFTTDSDGNLRTIARPPAPPAMPVVDLTARPPGADHAALQDFAAAPFDLGSGPLVRTLLLRLGPDHWCLALAAHHIVLDGWSLGLLLRQLGDAYGGRATTALPPATPQVYEPAALTAAQEFWRAELHDARPLDLPADRTHGPAGTWRGGSVPLELPPELVTRARELAAAHGITLFPVLLAAFGMFLARWADQDDLVVGTVTANRDRPGAASMVGLLADVLPVRIDTRPAELDFATMVDRVAARCRAAQAHPELSFDAIVRASGHRPDGGRAPLVRALFVLQNLPVAPWDAGGVHADPFEPPPLGAQFELALHLSPRPDGGLAGHLGYAADLLDPATVAHVSTALPALLSAALHAPTTTVADLPPTPGSGPVDGGPAALADGLVHPLIAAAAAEHGDITAVAWDGGALGYRELWYRVTELATRLRGYGVGPDQPVAICLPRSPELVVAVCAVLAAGGAYLPLDPTHPAGRLRGQLHDANVRTLIGERALAQSLMDGPVDDEPIVIVHTAPDVAAADLPPRPGHLANILHTSGSTGTPKAVLTTHAALANRLVWMQREYRLTPGEPVLHKTPVSFDVAGWELLWPLTVGATVVLARPDGHRDPAYLADTIVRHHVTTCHFVPSMLHMFLAEPSAARCGRVLRRIVCSGEELPPALARRCHEVLPGVRLDNLYGPTEAAIDVTAHQVETAEHPRTRVPIGRPIAGTRLRVLDTAGRPVGPLVPGELHIGGIAPARGYLGRPGQTAERFVPDPFGGGERLYRTGDRVRMRPDGALEYLGRVDRQVKIRGQRIEPGEIEAVLHQHPLVDAAVVEPRPGPDGRPRLTAWLVPAGNPPTLAQLREFLSAALPTGMVPDVFAVLPALPVGPHGKLDRTALPDATTSDERLAPEGNVRIAPRDPVEQRLAAIWSEVVGYTDPSVTDDFYESGGHSLLATRIAARVSTAFGVDIPVADLLGGGLTIARLAELVRARQLAAAGEPEVNAVLDWMSELSDHEVAALLANEAPGPPK